MGSRSRFRGAVALAGIALVVVTGLRPPPAAPESKLAGDCVEINAPSESPWRGATACTPWD